MELQLKGKKKPQRELQADGNMPPDLADDAKYIEMHDGTRSKMNLNDFQFISTLGTGTFGRVRLVKHKSEGSVPMALKCLKKSEIIRLKQIDHVKSEKKILASIQHPFIVRLFGTF